MPPKSDRVSGPPVRTMGGASDPEPEPGLRVGARVADVTLVEVLAAGGEFVCWRGQRADGREATVHALAPGASPAARKHFCSAATELAAKVRERPVVARD